MMKSLSPLLKEMEYASVVWRQSGLYKDVSFAVRKPSLAQRIELTGRVRELSLKHEFLTAGDSVDQLDASLSDLIVRRLYIEWGLVEIRGLRIDKERASATSLIERGPEGLVDEIVTAIKETSGLTDDERKNS